LDDIYNLELGEIMHKFPSGSLPDNFIRLFVRLCFCSPMYNILFNNDFFKISQLSNRVSQLILPWC